MTKAGVRSCAGTGMGTGTGIGFFFFFPGSCSNGVCAMFVGPVVFSAACAAVSERVGFGMLLGRGEGKDRERGFRASFVV